MDPYTLHKLFNLTLRKYLSLTFKLNCAQNSISFK